MAEVVSGTLAFTYIQFSEVVAGSALGYMLGRVMWHAMCWGAKRMGKGGLEKS